MITKSHTILYVQNQRESTDFYAIVLNRMPSLFAPGMTEFELTQDSILGLMPETGAVKLLGDTIPNPVTASGVPRVELYLMVQNPTEYHERAVRAGAKNLSDLKERDWGHAVAYSLDPDGHVLAFASAVKS